MSGAAQVNPGLHIGGAGSGGGGGNTWIGLSDTPAAYAGAAEQLTGPNTAETAIEYKPLTKVRAEGTVVVDNTLRSVLIGENGPGNWTTATGADTVAVGDGALAALEAGAGNIGIGTGALDAETDGSESVAIGLNALGAFNGSGATGEFGGAVAVGTRAMALTARGFGNNVAVGFEAMERMLSVGANGDSAQHNTAVGYRALRHQAGAQSGSKQNTAVGSQALENINDNVLSHTASGYLSGNALTSGQRNTLYGKGSGSSLTTGDDNILIGVDVQASGVGVDDELNIGDLIFGTKAPSAARIRIGGSGAITGDASLDLAQTDAAFRTNRLTDVQEAALTLADGMSWYNSDADQFRGHLAGNTESFQMVDPALNGFRLTPDSGQPIPDTSNNDALTVVYMSPYKSNRIALYDGTQWNVHESAEISYTLAGRTDDLPFDLFAYDNAGTLDLEVLDWTDATTRATAIVRQDGVWCQSGNLSRRWVGTCMPNAATTYAWVTRVIASGVGNPALEFGLFNADNRHRFGFLRKDTDSHTYAVNAWRQWRADDEFQVNVVHGVEEETIFAQATSAVSGAGTVRGAIGVSYDSTTSVAQGVQSDTVSISSRDAALSASMARLAQLGVHFVALVQRVPTSNTVTFIGGNNGAASSSGFNGTWVC